MGGDLTVTGLLMHCGVGKPFRASQLLFDAGVDVVDVDHLRCGEQKVVVIV